MRSRTPVLETAILGLLNESPLHGYELRKRLNLMLGSFRALSYGSLYPALKSLVARGLITGTEQTAAQTTLAPALSGKRARIVGWIYAVVLVFCTLAMVVALTRSRTLGFLLLFVEVAVIVAMRSFGLRGEARRLALAKRGEVRTEYFGEPQETSEEASAG